jgi:mono/diheme cytochrome c family protein
MRTSFSIQNLLLGGAVAVILGGCAAKGDNPGREYAPNMYHSVAYEPLSQITDKQAGAIVNALDKREGEFYNSNQFNIYAMGTHMNMRYPAPNTVRRNAYGWLPYRQKAVPKDSIPLVTANLVSPLDSSAVILTEGKLMYEAYCQHCHGAKGEGDGKVATGVKVDGVEKGVYPGVANLKAPIYASITEGHIFHVITNGAGLMGSHGSQVSEVDRWKIARYVKSLQK